MFFFLSCTLVSLDDNSRKLRLENEEQLKLIHHGMDPNEATLCFINAHHSLYLNKYLSFYFSSNNMLRTLAMDRVDLDS